jgi:hypothetical protein
MLGGVEDNVARRARLASLVANEKIFRGPGLIPHRRPEEGLRNGKAWREAQAAYDIMSGLRPREICQVIANSVFVFDFLSH